MACLSTIEAPTITNGQLEWSETQIRDFVSLCPIALYTGTSSADGSLLLRPSGQEWLLVRERKRRPYWQLVRDQFI
jgi:hypothetical protein